MTPQMTIEYRPETSRPIILGRDLLDKLYEGTLEYLHFAEQGVIENNQKKKASNISKALAVINELDCALDYHQGGGIASNLSFLYQYSITNLFNANRNNSVDEIRNVKKIIIEIKDAFQLSSDNTGDNLT
jgi:flagellar protein FliS